jgi:acyl-CoA dehydrogenase
MDFAPDGRTVELRDTLLDFMRTHVHPAEVEFARQMDAREDDPVERWAWSRTPVLASLREEARVRGLWNAFLPGDRGAGLTNLQYAPLAEITGRALQLAPASTSSAA